MAEAAVAAAAVTAAAVAATAAVTKDALTSDAYNHPLVMKVVMSVASDAQCASLYDDGRRRRVHGTHVVNLLTMHFGRTYFKCGYVTHDNPSRTCHSVWPSITWTVCCYRMIAMIPIRPHSAWTVWLASHTANVMNSIHCLQAACMHLHRSSETAFIR